MDESRFGPFEIRGEYSGFGAVVDWEGRRVYVDIVQDARVRERAAAALAVVDRFAEFVDTFSRFKASEAARRPDAADAISALELELVAFIAKKDPAFAEVSFTEASGGDLWFCAFKDGRFFDLAEEP